MILVADSGSSKTDWALIENKSRVTQYKSKGINPVHLSRTEILSIISEVQELVSMAGKVSKVYFFGAGCGQHESKSGITIILKSVFRNSEIEVDTDLMAAAIAACGNQSGIVGILGTGSNCCFYTGKEIILKNHGLGYILGDECSGAWFGKKILSDFFYEKMDAGLHEAFRSTFPLEKGMVIQNVYEKPGANRYLASFMPFIIKHKNNRYIQKLIHEGINEFFLTNVSGFRQTKNVYLVGSIAWSLSDEIKLYCENYSYSLKKIVRSPIEGLIENFTRIKKAT